MSAGVAAVVGAALTVPARLSLGVGLAWPGVFLLMEARGFLPAGGRLYDHDLEITRGEGAFLPCLSRFVFFACGILSAGSVYSRIDGLRESGRVFFHLTGGARVGLVLPVLSQLGLGAFLDAELVPLPVEVLIDKVNTWREPVAQIGIGFSIAGEIPALLR